MTTYTVNNQTITRPKNREIWMCNLNGEGSVQGGYRPVFILSNNMNNQYSTTINVIPMTSHVDKRRLPVHVTIWEYAKYGLRKPTTLMIEQLTTVSMDNLDKFVGKIDDSKLLYDICVAMGVQFPILNVMM